MKELMTDDELEKLLDELHKQYVDYYEELWNAYVECTKKENKGEDYEITKTN